MDRTAVLLTSFFKQTAEIRFHLDCQLIGNAVALDYRVVIVDASQDSVVRDAFSRIGAVVFPQLTKGIGPSRRELFRHAGEENTYPDASLPDIFIWMEEKVDLIRWIPTIIAPIRSGEADIVIPSQTEMSWQSYPKFQAESEQKANACYADATGRCLDVMFGPVAFSRAMLPYFVACNPADHFGVFDTYIQHIAPLEAMAHGARVVSVPIDFFYPSAQKAEEETVLLEAMREKRQWQLEECMNAYRVVAYALKLKS